MDPVLLDPETLQKYSVEYSVPESAIIDVKKAFDIIDINQNGSIQPSEFQAILEELGLNDEDGIATKTLIRELDLNSNGFVDFDEFLKFSLNKVDDKVEQEEAERIFKYYDNEGKEKIDVNDLAKVAKILGQKMTEDEVKKMLGLLDFDGDGFVEKKDFYDMMMGKLSTQPN
jgi:Ca2+-binding EF-hand superfamily protein